MTLNGEVSMKIASKGVNRWNTFEYNAFCLTSDTLTQLDVETEVVPVEAEMTLKKNTYENYAKSE
jgi:hypothetical protein